MKTYIPLVLLLLISMLLSCSDENSGSNEQPKSTYLISDDSINIPISIVDSLDIGTGKLTLINNISPDSMSGIGFGERKFMMNDKFYFNLYYTSSLNSAIVNSPVLFYNMYDSMLYFQDGYPPLESLGSNSNVEQVKEMRNTNWNALKDSWDGLIAMLKSNDIVVIDSTEKPIIEPEYPNSGDSIVIFKENVKSFDKETGKIELYNKIPFEDILMLKWEIYKFGVDSIPFFDVYFTTSGNSMVINRPVLFYDQYEEHFYLKDGYPMVEVLGEGKEYCQKIRDKNMKSIENEWLDFIQYIVK